MPHQGLRKASRHSQKSKPHNVDGSPFDEGNAASGKSNNPETYLPPSEPTDLFAVSPPSPARSHYVNVCPLQSQTTSLPPSASRFPMVSPTRISRPTMHVKKSAIRRTKGIRLFTQASFLSLPVPSLQPTDPSFSEPAALRSYPRPPLCKLTTRIRNTSPNSPLPTKRTSKEIQEFYDQVDPFVNHGETFFTPSLSFGQVPSKNLHNFPPYRCKPAHRQMSPLKRKAFDPLLL